MFILLTLINPSCISTNLIYSFWQYFQLLNIFYLKIFLPLLLHILLIKALERSLVY